MPQARSAARLSPSQRVSFLSCFVLVAASAAVWLFAFFPLMGNDYKFWVPLIHEGKIAWSSFGTLSYDFSPLRCLGLPSFSSPNSLIFSIFHGLSLFGNELAALALGIAFILSFAFVGALRLFRFLGLPDRAALLLATGWCLQGWACARLIAGHLPFLQLLLLPWLLYVAIAGRSHLISLLASAFWLTHMLYSGAFYSFIIACGSVGLCVGMLLLPVAAPLARIDPKLVLRNVTALGGLTTLMMVPKVLGVLDFLALFPREARLAQVPFWKSLLYALANVAIPFPINFNSWIGWSFGNWESYQFLYPGLFVVLAVLAVQKRLPSGGRIVLTLASLLILSATLTSGLLAPLFAALPVLESLHVNPRWNAIILLPLVLLACVVVVETNFLKGERDRVGFFVLLALFCFAPLQFLDRIDMRIGYLYQDGVKQPEGRVDICYEPIFGYGLERFPTDPRRIDWSVDPLRDPRCLLASGDCRPGSSFESTIDREQLERYALKDDHPPVVRFKVPALLLYGLGFGAAVVCFARLFREGMREAEDVLPDSAGS